MISVIFYRSDKTVYQKNDRPDLHICLFDLHWGAAPVGLVRADRLTDKLADRQTLLLVYVDVQPVQEESPGTYKTKAEAKKNQIENDSYP